MDFAAATRAESAGGARVEQAQIIVNFGGRGYSRTRVAGGVFLLDGDRWSDAGDFVYVGLFDALEELAGICGKRFDIAPLAFGVDSVEGQAGLSRSRDSGDHGYGIVGNLEADVLQVVNASAGNHDGRGLVKDFRLIDDCGLIAHGSSHALKARY